MTKYIDILKYTAVALTSLYGIYRIILPFINRVKKYLNIVSVANIEHITEISYRGLYKSENIITHIGMPEYVCKSDGQCLYASPRLCEIYGRIEADMLGFGWSTSIIQDDRDRALNKWIDCVKNKKPYEDTYMINTEKGKLLITTKTRVCFGYDSHLKRQTDEILFYIGTVYVNSI